MLFLTEGPGSTPGPISPIRSRFRPSISATLFTDLSGNGMTAFVMPATSWWTAAKPTHNSPPGDGMGDCRADGTRTANSPWLIVFLLLAFGFTPILRAQVHIAQSPPWTVHVFVALADNKNQ